MTIDFLKMRLITYGCGNAFDNSLWRPITNQLYNIKPKGGLWASPVNCNYGWKDWCEVEEFGDLSSWFEFNYSGLTLIIDSLEDSAQMPIIPDKNNLDAVLLSRSLDFEKMLKTGIDAIYLTEKGQNETRFAVGLKGCLYGWDCESVLIMNKDCVY